MIKNIINMGIVLTMAVFLSACQTTQRTINAATQEADALADKQSADLNLLSTTIRDLTAKAIEKTAESDSITESIYKSYGEYMRQPLWKRLMLDVGEGLTLGNMPDSLGMSNMDFRRLNIENYMQTLILDEQARKTRLEVENLKDYYTRAESLYESQMRTAQFKLQSAILENTQITKPQFARLGLPLTDAEKEKHMVQLSTAQNGDILIEQHAFNGGRITAMFYSNNTVFKKIPNKDILTAVMNAPFVVDFMGDGRTMGSIKNHFNTDLGAGNYALIENTNRTKYCVVFRFAYMHPHIVQDITTDGALCRSAAEENAITMEFYAKEFITALHLKNR